MCLSFSFCYLIKDLSFWSSVFYFYLRCISFLKIDHGSISSFQRLINDQLEASAGHCKGGVLKLYTLPFVFLIFDFVCVFLYIPQCLGFPFNKYLFRSFKSKNQTFIQNDTWQIIISSNRGNNDFEVLWTVHNWFSLVTLHCKNSDKS